MKRRFDIILKSLGSEYMEDPDVRDLANWIKDQKGSGCDLITYKLERSLLSQRRADIPCTGGLYYSDRLSESIGGLKSGGLCSEPYPVTTEMSQDAERIRKIRKGSHVALPVPSSLGISDYYFNDHQDFISSLCEVFKKLMREQRDRGIKGHILISDRFSRIELEELSGPKTYLFSPSGGSKVISSILEYQEKIAVFPDKIDSLFEIMPEYDLKAITLIDPGDKDLERLLSEFDPDSVLSGGYCRGCERDYWDDLKERSFVIV
ncbi:MAG: hypothetical protein JW931_09580 [Methanomicrobiaceae archaeon]|nr:hypothetical protein [Methanomicrobiaceae archaeon]